MMRAQIAATGLRPAIAAFVTVVATNAGAQVVTDGSLGAQTALAGPHFLIDDALGQTRGHNLFHSFSTFSIGVGQTATFDSAVGVDNIIARVTGGNLSQINGTLSADANLFLLNPQGVMFGAGAVLDVNGTFHVSTADYLRFDSGERFYASLGPSSVLSVAVPTAFGFLDSSVGGISVNSSRLTGADGSALSFVGGNLVFDNSTVDVERGQLNLAAVASAGEVVVGDGALDASSFSTLATIRLRQSSVNPAEGEAASIYVRGGQFIMEGNSTMETVAQSAGAPRVIDIDVDSLSLQGSAIVSVAAGTGAGVPVVIRAGSVSLTNGSVVLSAASGDQRGGDVTVQTGSLTVNGGLSLLGTSAAAGQMGDAGNLTINATTIDVTDGVLTTIASGAGDSGDVRLTADRISLHAAGFVTSGTSGSGNGGLVSVEARELVLEGGNTALPTAIGATSNSTSSDAGDAGTIHIDVDTLHMSRAAVSSSTSGPGRGGEINISAGQMLMENGSVVQSDTFVVNPAPGYGNGGAIGINVDTLQMHSDSRISALTQMNGNGGTVTISGGSMTMDGSASVTAISVGTGNAGNLSIQMADNLEISGDSEVVTGAVQGSGGNIALDVGNRLLLRDSIIVTSVLGGGANSGNISISDPVFVILDTGEIRANAVAGNGGNIDITTQFLMKSVDSMIDASSEVGVDGQIDIVDSGVELNADIVPLPSDFLDAQHWLTQPCAARQGTSVSQFTVNGRDGAYRSPDDFAASPWLAGDALSAAAADRSQYDTALAAVAAPTATVHVASGTECSWEVPSR